MQKNDKEFDNRDWKTEETNGLMTGIAKNCMNRIKGRRKLKHTKIIY